MFVRNGGIFIFGIYGTTTVELKADSELPTQIAVPFLTLLDTLCHVGIEGWALWARRSVKKHLYILYRVN